jgi:hypothetical protein
MKTWRDKLTKAEQAHLKECGVRTLENVKATAALQDELRFPCWDCVRIARKLEIPVSLTAFHDKKE